MKHIVAKFTLLLAMIAIGSTALAQGESYDKPTNSSAEKPISKMKSQNEGPKVSTEFGLSAGARYNIQFGVTPTCKDFTPVIKMPASFVAALQFRLNIGRSFGIQPEIAYTRNFIKISDKQYGKDIKPKSNIVQIPMLLSFRIAMFRFNAGPVFTLMDENTYQLSLGEDIQQMHLGRLFPTVTYAAGISVKLGKVSIIDIRYADQFMDTKSENQWVWTLDTAKQPAAQTFRTSCRSVQVRYGVVF